MKKLSNTETELLIKKPCTLYLSVFSPNAGKYGPEKLRIRILFTQCVLI